MRRFLAFSLSLVLFAAGQGCHRTMQHTGGACDCYPPPVESLLVAPCASGYNTGMAHPSPGYSSSLPLGSKSGTIPSTPPTSSTESIQIPPKIVDSPK